MAAGYRSHWSEGRAVSPQSRVSLDNGGESERYDWLGESSPYECIVQKSSLDSIGDQRNRQDLARVIISAMET